MKLFKRTDSRGDVIGKAENYIVMAFILGAIASPVSILILSKLTNL